MVQGLVGQMASGAALGTSLSLVLPENINLWSDEVNLCPIPQLCTP